jgi:hypothetical protein
MANDVVVNAGVEKAGLQFTVRSGVLQPVEITGLGETEKICRDSHLSEGICFLLAS